MEDDKKIIEAITRLGGKIEALSDRIEWVVGSIHDHEMRIRTLEDCNTKDHETRLRVVEDCQSNLMGKIAGVMVVFGAAISLVAAWIGTWP